MKTIICTQDCELELQKLLSNIENIKADVDLYSIFVEEKIFESV